MKRTLICSLTATLSLLQGCAATRSDAERELGVQAGANYAIVNVFYATDRKSTQSEDVGKRFGGERGELKYGTAKVSIPRNHKMGALEAPSVWKFQFRADPEKHVVLLDLEAMDATAFFQSVATQIKRSTRNSAFVFVHGYNVTFEDAARRTAQISYDLGFDGAPVFYSWPSQGDVAKYTFDESNVAWSTANLERFLVDFAEKSQADKIYLIGHSMGTRAMTQAYVSLLSSRPALKKKFVEVILAAPDMDADVFKRDIAPAMLAGEGKITLYASSDDVPLKASKAVHGGYPRAGDAGAAIVLVNGVESIDATGMGTDFLNHSYFAGNRSIISDIFYIVHDGFRAQNRAGLELVLKPNVAGMYWRFRR
jgi:esterase/lipase superfamily enzyme